MLHSMFVSLIDSVKVSVPKLSLFQTQLICETDNKTILLLCHKLICASWTIKPTTTEQSLFVGWSGSIISYLLKQIAGRERRAGWARLTFNERESDALHCQFISLSHSQQKRSLLNNIKYDAPEGKKKLRIRPESASTVKVVHCLLFSKFTHILKNLRSLVRKGCKYVFAFLLWMCGQMSSLKCLTMCHVCSWAIAEIKTTVLRANRLRVSTWQA